MESRQGLLHPIQAKFLQNERYEAQKTQRTNKMNDTQCNPSQNQWMILQSHWRRSYIEWLQPAMLRICTVHTVPKSRFQAYKNRMYMKHDFPKIIDQLRSPAGSPCTSKLHAPACSNFAMSWEEKILKRRQSENTRKFGSLKRCSKIITLKQNGGWIFKD